MQENGKFKGSHAPQNEFRIFLRNLLLFNATNTNKVLLKRKGDYWSWDSLFFLIPHFCRKNQSPENLGRSIAKDLLSVLKENLSFLKESCLYL